MAELYQTLLVCTICAYVNTLMYHNTLMAPSPVPSLSKVELSLCWSESVGG